MSRCFPYPPPGYSLNTANNEALIESIKLQREKEKAKAERKKEKKREKKEKKREEKTKRESSKFGFDKAPNRGNNCEFEGRYLKKAVEDEAEQLERSNLTEEHGHPVGSQNSSCSSDSTQNSNKRKRPASPTQSIHAHGSIIRIKLSKKGDGCDTPVSKVSKVESLAKPARQDAEVAVRTAAERVNPLIKTRGGQAFPAASLPEPSPSTSGRTILAEDIAAIASCSKVQENKVEAQYKNLIERSWLPPSLKCEPLDFDDQAWLFQRKHKSTRVEEKNGVNNDTSCGSCVLWPRAQYLHEAEVYALPFTVPF